MTPDTRWPFYVAYTVTAVVFIGYSYSIWARAKRVRAELARRADSVVAPAPQARKADPSLRSG